jgi:hypothetical protein
MISQITVDQIIQSLSRLRIALNELALVAHDFQFEHDTVSRLRATQQTENLLNAIRRDAP